MGIKVQAIENLLASNFSNLLFWPRIVFKIQNASIVIAPSPLHFLWQSHHVTLSSLCSPLWLELPASESYWIGIKGVCRHIHPEIITFLIICLLIKVNSYFFFLVVDFTARTGDSVVSKLYHWAAPPPLAFWCLNLLLFQFFLLCLLSAEMIGRSNHT